MKLLAGAVGGYKDYRDQAVPFECGRLHCFSSSISLNILFQTFGRPNSEVALRTSHRQSPADMPTVLLYFDSFELLGVFDSDRLGKNIFLVVV